MTKELMIKAIYEKIADGKTHYKRVDYGNNSSMDDYDIAVMIGDVLDYMENLDYLISDEDKIFFLLDWEHKRKPLEMQSDDCIEYIFNLISK